MSSSSIAGAAGAAGGGGEMTPKTGGTLDLFDRSLDVLVSILKTFFFVTNEDPK
jgi:hypothetical protein